jgi:hypothetical protein
MHETKGLIALISSIFTAFSYSIKLIYSMLLSLDHDSDPTNNVGNVAAGSATLVVAK